MVFFFANMWSNDYSRGITKKVYAQIQAMNNIGYSVNYYTGYEENSAAIYNLSGEKISEILFPTKYKFVQRVFRNYSLKSITSRFFAKHHQDIQIVYFRYVYFDPLTIKMLKTAKSNGYFTILEIHSFPLYFWKDYLLWPIFILDLLCRKKALSYVDRIVALTDQKNLFGKETINIENGIDLKSIRPQLRNSKTGVIRIISVSYEWAVHGYDRILNGLAEYYKKKNNKYNIEIIFVGTVLNKTKKLIKKLGIQSHVILTGKKFGSDLDEIYDHCDLGMGCLAIHRRKTQTVSTIKTREYIAKGIPFFYAGKPLSSEMSCPFALRLKSEEGPIDMDKIIEFYEKTEKIPNRVEIMRNWAQKYTWEEQMKKVFAGVTAKVGI